MHLARVAPTDSFCQRLAAVRQLKPPIAIEATRLRDELVDDGNRLSTTDMLIAATARSTGDELVVADADFRTAPLEDVMAVTNRRE
ncbi:PIN domain-containing protein [Halapricum desulfuricans]|uniref:PIN domain containing protein n=1 Tax=Halapricum desulfuricans TaxID=2841257 RepID=A0A897MZB9_9EURY|nr:PIN domain-containing protein [Halapricum desulfuricans]QSG06002.1 PIN domain containing protein [Halapricum desulfuricans]